MTVIKDLIYYKCFNEGECSCAGDGNAWPAGKWLKVKFPNLFNLFRKEMLQAKNDSMTDKEKELKAERRKQHLINEENNKKEKELKKKQEADSVKHFVPILKGKTKIFNTAIEFCKKREIPEEYWKKFFVCTDGVYKNRLIIPFYNHKNEIYYFQGRSLVGQEPKYINRRSSKENALFNWFNVDKTKPIIVVEGPIDAMFIENAIATLGLGIPSVVQEELDKLKVFWLLDNDTAGKELSKKYLKNGKNVFLWNKFKYNNGKDINEIYTKNGMKKRLTYDDLKHCFTNHYYDSIYLEM